MTQEMKEKLVAVNALAQAFTVNRQRQELHADPFRSLPRANSIARVSPVAVPNECAIAEFKDDFKDFDRASDEDFGSFIEALGDDA